MRAVARNRQTTVSFRLYVGRDGTPNIRSEDHSTIGTACHGGGGNIGAGQGFSAIIARKTDARGHCDFFISKLFPEKGLLRPTKLSITHNFRCCLRWGFFGET
jgi:hypothetical protein